MEARYKTEMRSRRRRPGETLQELAQDLRRLLALAYPGPQTDLHRQVLTDSFIASLNDSELELKIREHEPTNLEEAVKLAIRTETIWAEVVSSRRSVRQTTTEVAEEKSECLDVTATARSPYRACLLYTSPSPRD